MKKQFFLGLGALALLASCSNDHEGLEGNIYDGYLHVNGTINEVVKTRVNSDGTAFTSGDVIGVLNGSSNVSYTYNGTTFAATSDGIKLTEQISVSAYYPYTASLSGNAISFDVNQDQNVDFLYAPAKQVSPDSPTAEFQFTHSMAMISLKVVDKTEASDLNPTTISIKLNNVATTGSFSTADGKVTPGTATGTVTLNPSALNTPASAIVASYDAATKNSTEIEVQLVVDDKTYTGSIKPELLAGNNYTYDLNIIDSTVPEQDTDLVISGGITAWNPVDGDSTDMEEGYVLQVGDYLLKDGSTISPSKYAENSQNVVGVVYYVGNPQPSYLYSDKVQESQDILKAEAPTATNGLALAINNANNGNFKRLASAKYDLSAWWEGSGSTKVNQLFQPTGFNKADFPNQFCGYNNTRILEMADEDDSDNSTYGLNDLITILTDYNSANKVDKASKWFLTSYAEFNQIASVYAAVNASIVKANGTLTQYTNSAKADTENFYWTSDYRNGTYAWVSVIDPYEDVANAIQTKNSNGTQGYFRLSIAF